MSGLEYRREIRLTRTLRLVITHRGMSLAVRKGRVSASTRGSLTVRILRGLSWRHR